MSVDEENDRPRRKPRVAKDDDDDRPRRRREDDEYDDDDRPRRRREDDEYDDDDRPRKRRRRRDDDEEEGDSTGGLIPYKNPKALLAYYVGIFGFFLPLIGSIAAVVLGFKGLKYAKAHPKARGQAHAVIGIICGILGTCFYLFILAIAIIAAVAK